MYDQHQGQSIDQSKMIGGRRAMTQSHRRERQSGQVRWFRDFSGYTT